MLCQWKQQNRYSRVKHRQYAYGFAEITCAKWRSNSGRGCNHRHLLQWQDASVYFRMELRKIRRWLTADRLDAEIHRHTR